MKKYFWVVGTGNCHIYGRRSVRPLVGTSPGKERGTQAAVQPVKGGNIRILTSVISPKAIGYIPEWGPGELIAALPWAERLVLWDEKGKLRS